MRLWLHKLEKAVDRSIAPLLVILLAIIILELTVQSFERYHHYVDYFDLFVIVVFAVDLGFKYNRVRNIPKFMKTYWIEVIATIPFFLIFRVIEFAGLAELIERGQHAVHEAQELPKLEREASGIVKEAGRGSRTLRYARIGSRLPRFFKASIFHEKASGKHYRHERKSA